MSCSGRYASMELPPVIDVALAVLEVDGSISCLKFDDLNPNANNHLAQRRKILPKHQ
jgi:uncharacterized membrane protein YcaP (DUF421 family)